MSCLACVQSAPLRRLAGLGGTPASAPQDSPTVGVIAGLSIFALAGWAIWGLTKKIKQEQAPRRAYQATYDPSRLKRREAPIW